MSFLAMSEFGVDDKLAIDTRRELSVEEYYVEYIKLYTEHYGEECEKWTCTYLVKFIETNNLLSLDSEIRAYHKKMLNIFMFQRVGIRFTDNTPFATIVRMEGDGTCSKEQAVQVRKDYLEWVLNR